MDQPQPDGRPPQPPVPPTQPPAQPAAAPAFPTPAAWQSAPQQQGAPQQYGSSPSAPPAAWQGDHATYLQTVPTAIYQAPSQGGYPSYQQAQAMAPATGTVRSTWSLVTGLIGLVISIFVGWGFGFSIVAIILGFIARPREPRGRGRALTGIVTGCVGLACSVGWFVYSIVVIVGYVST